VGTDLLPKIKHVVVLMMENHSYDNYFGAMRDDQGDPRGDGFRFRKGVPTNSNRAIDGTEFFVTHAGTTHQWKGVPTQAWSASHEQRGRFGKNDGFVQSVEHMDQAGLHVHRDVPMWYWDERDLPFYHGLASTFPLMDRWFSSCLGPTFPNRRFLLAATAHGLIDDVVVGLFDYPRRGTILDVLTAHGITWINYHWAPMGGLFAKRILGKAGLQAGRALGLVWRGLTGQMRAGVKGALQFTGDLYPLGFLPSWNHLRRIECFFEDARNGTLPALSIVDPDFEQTSEENPQDIHDGEGFAAAVIHAVTESPCWPDTLLIWTYDEHGGYYDHFDPPRACAPDGIHGRSLLDGVGPFAWLLRQIPLIRRLMLADRGPRGYTRCGFRVPTVVVCPYARRGYISSIQQPDAVYDHTSILKLVERKWNLPPLTKRDEAAIDPLAALNLDAAPSFPSPVPLQAPAIPWPVPTGDGRRCPPGDR
jgi:phospholipase C